MCTRLSAGASNELRAVVRAAGLLLLALSILNFAPFAYSQERGIVGTIDNPAECTALLVSICIELLQLDLRRKIEGMTRSSPIPWVLEGLSRRTVMAKRIVATG